ncbi:MAG: ABC transporter ATP-binding protein [Hyphomicrobiaceae bacterium]|nr:ABC transporter ATP-binding protein [Hyphomicrobiaceae bacterium]
MPAIELRGVTKKWPGTVAVDTVSFTVEEGSFVVLLGPSGCGKSTTLRMIAGLEDVSEGTVLINDTDMTGATPAERRVSMVFQSYAIFPHLDVRENILFGLKVRKIPATEQSERLSRVADLVGLSDLLDRKPAQLSGGQRQRVALARAIIAENPICLMDEPLSNLDAKLRHEMRIELRALQRRLGMTVVYVTHDQTEAMSMADRVILMREGQIEQIGTPDELYDTPATTFTASFIGTPPMNLIALESGSGGGVVAGTKTTVVAGKLGQNRILGIRPEHITVTTTGKTAGRRKAAPKGVPAQVSSCDYLGADTIVEATCGEQSILVRVPGRCVLEEGERVGLSWSNEDVHVFDAETGQIVPDAEPLSVAA